MNDWFVTFSYSSQGLLASSVYFISLSSDVRLKEKFSDSDCIIGCVSQVSTIIQENWDIINFHF